MWANRLHMFFFGSHGSHKQVTVVSIHQFQKSYKSGRSDRNATFFFGFLPFVPCAMELSERLSVASRLSPSICTSNDARADVGGSLCPTVEPFVSPMLAVPAPMGAVVRLSPTPPSRSRCKVSKISLFRVHLNARLFSPLPLMDTEEDANPRNVENLSLGGRMV